ncbi:MAG: hypothetical protein ACHQ0J_08210 [Candidatus Dormibacterales bacterium]
MSAHRAIALLAAVAATAVACSNSSTVGSRSPSPAVSAVSPQTSPPSAGSPPGGASPSPSSAQSPTPVTGSFGVLVTVLTSGNYTVSLIGVDGKVVASAQASSPATVSCAGTAAAVVPPPVSTSNTRVYFMDAQGVVRFLSPNGDTGQATSVPVGSARRSMFAVSPDDQRIAVVVADFAQGGASTRLYVEDLNGGGNHVDPFSETGSFTLWPTGWHGVNNLVVAKVPACTQGGGPLCCGPQELHVVDPNTATRRFTLGGPTCVIAGAASPAGVVCENTQFTLVTVVNWVAVSQRSTGIPGPAPAYLSPDGTLIAIVDFSTASTAVNGASRTMALQACGWIDATHLLAGGDAQQQPRVGDVTSGTIVPVAAQGDCGGRIPGGL